MNYMNYSTLPVTTAIEWTDAPPTEAGVYVFVSTLLASVTRDPLSWAKMLYVRNIETLGLIVTFDDSIYVPVTALHGKWLRIVYASNDKK